jgi:hypothetical protein
MNNNKLIIGIVSFILILRVGLFIHKRMEKFDPLYDSKNDIYIKSVETIGEEPTILSNGVVQKYEKDNGFLYILNFNLPSTGSSFQTTDLEKAFNVTRKEEYRVLAGNSIGDMKQVGNLERQLSGIHYLELNSKEDYSRICVMLGQTLVSCVKL